MYFWFQFSSSTETLAKISSGLVLVLQVLYKLVLVFKNVVKVVLVLALGTRTMKKGSTRINLVLLPRNYNNK